MYKPIWTLALPSSQDTLYSDHISKDLVNQNSSLSPYVKCMFILHTHMTNTLWQYFLNSVIGNSIHPVLPVSQAQHLGFKCISLYFLPCAIYNQDPIPFCPHLCRYPDPHLHWPSSVELLTDLPAPTASSTESASKPMTLWWLPFSQWIRLRVGTMILKDSIWSTCSGSVWLFLLFAGTEDGARALC